ncbi:MAG: hypothetical protein FJ213_08570 [Ignavibacteria bacterium]|nr:hypothetical protein [Ignavibacteria bacterium]
MLRVIFYAIVFYLVYRFIKLIAEKYLSPTNQKNSFQKKNKRDIIDIDYEEVDENDKGKQ